MNFFISISSGVAVLAKTLNSLNLTKALMLLSFGLLIFFSIIILISKR